jgi:hypothetical protein
MQTREFVLLLGVIAAVGIATAATFRRWRRIQALSGEPMRFDAVVCVEDAAAAVPDLNVLLRRALTRDLSLAAEHVHSIRTLLEIARQHQQPIPSLVLTNLELVSKDLAEIQRQFEGDETASESRVSAVADHREIPPPLPPRTPSFGCHVSPFDRSAPCD